MLMRNPQLEYADGLPMPRRLWSVAAILLAITMTVIDGSIANVALPAIAEDLHATPSFSIWIVNGYQLAITISLLPLSSLGDIIGYRRVYLAGLGLFVVASLFCSLSHTLALLTAARVLQGFGAAGVMSVNAALVRFTYPHRMLGRGIGFNALTVALSAAIGPTIASGILAIGTWPWLFAVNIPFGVAALAIGWRALPHVPRGTHDFDWVSAVYSALTFGVGIAAIDSAGHGEMLWLCVTEFIVAAIAGMLLVRRQYGVRHPLLPVDLLRIPIFGLSICTSIASFCAQMLAFTALPFYLHYSFGISAVQIGLLIAPWPVGVAVAAPLAGRLVERYPAGLLGSIGLVFFGGGLLALAFLPPHPGFWEVGWRMALSGAGFGLFQAPNNRTMIAAAPRERSGGASGMLGTARLLGQTTGAALVALMLGRYGQDGTRLALFAATGFSLLGACLSALRLSEVGRQGANVVRVKDGQRATGE